ncbi:hypothetical protein SAMN05414139_06669 [Burkholderia sp. D7]|jgi:hypothetical protein|nr:hypothetical protein SAMN05414139_06669 [Burkholderia sp. D7]
MPDWLGELPYQQHIRTEHRMGGGEFCRAEIHIDHQTQWRGTFSQQAMQGAVAAQYRSRARCYTRRQPVMRRETVLAAHAPGKRENVASVAPVLRR